MLKRSPGIYKAEAIAPIFHASKYRRVDWIDLADSNEIQGGSGRNHGIQFALSTIGYSLYGTGLFSGNENAGSGSQSGYFCGSTNDGARPNDNASMPAALDTYNKTSISGLSGPQFATHYSWFMNDSQSTGNNTGYFISTGGPHDVNSNWRSYWRYANPSTAGTGNFRPTIRRGDSPFTQLAIGTETATGGGNNALVTATLDLAAATRNYQLDFRWGPSAYTINGPTYFLWAHAADILKTSGWQVSFMIYRGGQGLFEFCKAVQGSDPGMTEFVRTVTEAQTGDAMALFVIDSGLNDRNDAADLSLGPVGGLPSDTAAGFADNTRGVMNEIIDAWVTGNGFKRENLYFLLWPSNPVSNRDDGQLVAYRSASQWVADSYPNTAVLNTDMIFNTYLQSNAAAWYASGGTDTNHLTTTGYEQTSLLGMQALVQAVGGF